MSSQPPHPVRLALGGLIALAAAMGIGRFVYTPILPAMAEALALTQSEAGLIASANFLGYLVGALAAAVPRLPGSRRTLFLGALAASGATTALTGVLSAVTVLVMVRFAAGVASAFVLVFASTVILERLAQIGRSGLSGVHFAGVGLGIAVSAALVSALATLGYGWRAQWMVTGAVAMAATVLVAKLVPVAEPRGGGPSRAALPSLTPRLTALIAAYGLFGFGYVVTATFLVAIVRGSPEGRSLEPVVWVVVGLTAVPSVVLWNALGRRIGVYAAFGLACLVEAIGVAASVLASGMFGIIVAAVLLGGTFMAITSLGFAGARALSRVDPHRVLALMTAAFGAGQIIGPVLAGALYDRTGSFTLPSLLAAGALVVAAALGGWPERPQRVAAPTHPEDVTRRP